MNQELIDRVNAGVQARGIEYLQDMATREPARFLELIAYVLEQPQPSEVRSVSPVRFIYTQQPDSDNRT